MKKKTRLDYVDIFRGLPVLLMVLHQIFDVLWSGSIYTSHPYHVDVINSTTWYPWGFIFAFVSGMSVYLLFEKKYSVVGGLKTVWAVVKRYGIYILVSLPFTWFMWDINIFLRWEEVLQGIGLTAIIVATYWLITRKWKWYWHWVTIFVFALLQANVPRLLINWGVTPMFPQTPIADWTAIVSVLLNMTVRGWFSIANYFPFMLGGLLFVQLFKNRTKLNRLYLYAFLPLLFSIIIHLAGFPIDHNGRSFALTFFGIGETAIFCVILYHIYLKRWKISNMFFVLGRAAIMAYLGHFLLIVKPIELLGWDNQLGHLTSWIITIPLFGILYGLSILWLKWKKINYTLYEGNL